MILCSLIPKHPPQPLLLHTVTDNSGGGRLGVRLGIVHSVMINCAMRTKVVPMFFFTMPPCLQEC